MTAGIIAAVVFGAWGVAYWYFGRENPPEFPCPVCGAPDRNCYGRLTSACGSRGG